MKSVLATVALLVTLATLVVGCAAPTPTAAAPTAAPAPPANKETTTTTSAPVAACLPTVADASGRLAQFATIAPVFRGGLVLRLPTSTAATKLEQVLHELDLAGVDSTSCPDGGAVWWLPGVDARLGDLVAERGVVVSEMLVFAPAEGAAWLERECSSPARCEAIALVADPGGLCGLALASLHLVSPAALARCRTLAAATVACALAAPPASRRCQQSLKQAVAAP